MTWSREQHVYGPQIWSEITVKPAENDNRVLSLHLKYYVFKGGRPHHQQRHTLGLAASLQWLNCVSARQPERRTRRAPRPSRPRALSCRFHECWRAITAGAHCHAALWVQSVTAPGADHTTNMLTHSCIILSISVGKDTFKSNALQYYITSYKSN